MAQTNLKSEIEFRMSTMSKYRYYLANLIVKANYNPAILKELKEHLIRLREKIGDKAGWEIPKEKIEDIPASFHKYLSDRELGDLLNGFDITNDQLRQLSSMSGIVESAVDVKEKRVDIIESLDEFDKMAEISGGEFVYQDGKKTINKPYLIDVYPVL